MSRTIMPQSCDKQARLQLGIKFPVPAGFEGRQEEAQQKEIAPSVKTFGWGQ